MSHALIFGASGISGWSLLNQARNYPTPTTFSRITGLTNRPFSLKQAQLPEDDRIQIVPGINLTKSVEEVTELLRSKVVDVESVSHVFFLAYIEGEDHESRSKINTHILEVAVRAIENVSKNLKMVVLQTGGKAYGLEFPKEVGIHPPLKESLPRIPEPWRSKIFYYTQVDMLKKLSASKSWTFSEIRPDGIVGFAPGSNYMNMSQGMAVYLSIYRKVYGKSAKVAFPGFEHGYHSTHTDTFQDLLSRLEIYAALNPDKCGDGRAFNSVDSRKAITWAQVWPKICEHFGLVGTGPTEGTEPMLDFVKKHRSVWKELCDKYQLGEKVIDEQGWGHVHFMMVQFDFDREFDMTATREAGFTEEIDTVEAYFIAWERMRQAHILPPLSAFD